MVKYGGEAERLRPKDFGVSGTPRGLSCVYEPVDVTAFSIHELVVAAGAGDRAAREELFRRFWPVAWRRAFTVVGVRAAADDIAQDALITGMDRLGDLEHPERFAGWLDRVVVNRCVDWLRRESRLVGLDPEGGVSVDWTGGAAADHDLRRAVAGLDPDRRVVVALRYWLDLTPTEIAEVVGVPVGTVNSRLARALSDLRVTLGAGDGG